MGGKNNPARSANPCKSFCYFWLSPKVESHLPLNPNLLVAHSATKQSTKTKHALNLFYKIAQIPHPSGHTKDLQKFIIDFLKQCDCKVESDSAGNIHALKGAPKLVFQAHYDMVLVGQKVAPFVENGFLKSRDSSLGADNGIAVALLLDFAQKCKNFEILLTNDEEIGMLGAKNLTLQTQSKTMINLDSECLNEICVGCAGGFDADISLADFSADLGVECLKNAEIYELSAQNFKGGHSGIDIDKNIKNAIVELLWRLESLRQKCEFSILEISGGENRNSIPINAKAVIAIQTNKTARSANPCPTRHTEATKSPKYPNKSKKIAQPNLARFVVQKIGIKDAVVPSADFLLESDKRGSPPKSEKAAAFWRVGGAGRGVQPFLRKEKGDSISEKIVGDSRIAKMDSSRCRAQNDESFMDCHDSTIAESRNDDIFLDSSLIASLNNAEYMAKSAPQIALKKLKSYTPNHMQNPLNSAIIPHLLRLHNGIYEKNSENITSSLNFSLLSNESLKIMVRANSAEFLERHKTRLKALFGDSVNISGFYNAWDSSSDSPILGALQWLYDKHKIAHKVVQIHAGLECGILKEKCALREVVSIGPTIFHPHSKNEALDLDSFGKIYDILCDLMEQKIIK